MLSNYETAKKNNKSKQVAERINSFSFTLLEFEAAYKREDYLWATRLGHHLVGDMSIVLSYIYDKDKHYLGLKRLHKNLEDITLRKYSKIVDMIKLSTILTGIFELMNFLDQQLKVLPNEVLENTNIEFFNFMVKRISSIDLKNKMGSN